MHLWRKRVKDLRYAAEMLNAREIASRADDLGEMLGAEHDLALLGARIRAEAKGDRGKASARRTRKQLLKLIAKRRKRLRRRALSDGKALYRRSPEKFVKHVRSAHARVFKS